MKLACHTITWGRDLKGALADIRALGFAGFESFGPEAYGGEEAYRSLAAASGLRVASVYSAGSFIDPDEGEREIAAMKKTAMFLSSLGSREMVIGGGRKRPEGNNRQDYEIMAARLNRIGEFAREQGLRACFHPHSGTCVENGPQVDLLMELTDPALVYLCSDIAHLQRGGADPALYVAKHSPRVGYVHLKDLAEDGRFVELGQGRVDLPAVLKALKDGGYEGWAVVELDTSNRTPKESAEMSLRYLERLGLAA